MLIKTLDGGPHAEEEGSPFGDPFLARFDEGTVSVRGSPIHPNRAKSGYEKRSRLWPGAYARTHALPGH